MAKVLSVEEIKKIILEYICDDRRTQAILLDGDWGCGKTYFLKERLIPDLKKDDSIIFFKISLYGIADVKNIQEMIYSSWIEKYMCEKTENMGQLGNWITKGANLFGKAGINFLESKIGAEDFTENLAEKIIDSQLANKEKVVFIFDDIERCQIDMTELMGYLNNMSENNGFKLILVANEKEINRCNNISETALKYNVSLNARLETDSILKKQSDKSRLNEANAFTKEELESVSNYIFGQASLYERTREKLVGLTIPYSLSLSEAFESIVNKYIRKKKVQKYMFQYKVEIVEMFERFEHRNLRTFIAVCIASEDILNAIDETKYKDEEILFDEIKIVILYITYSAIRRATGKSLFVWKKDSRYAFIDGDSMAIYGTKIYGYAFVDEYWRTQCIDEEVICRDIFERVNSKLKIQIRKDKNKEHLKLALFQLIKWYYLSDEDVKRLVLQMKNELSEKKYYPQEFQDIICTLMKINNPNFGLKYEENRNQKENTIYDITDSSQFANMHLEEVHIIKHMYSDWDEYKIEEYVELMMKYFDDPEFVIDNKMIRVLSEDKRFAFKYRKYVLPILNKIDEIEMRNVAKKDNGIGISDMEWDNVFEEFVSTKKIEFMDQGHFLSLFDFNKFKIRLNNASTDSIYCLIESIELVYSFSNIVDVYSADLPFINQVLNYIRRSNGDNINSEKSRTKEIAISRLEYDLKEYQERLSMD